jgi:hypothetical protein
MSSQGKAITPLILHCHIPKTAGTTISAGFRNTFEFFHLHHYHPNPFYILRKETLESLLEIFPDLRSISSHHLRSFPLSVGTRPTFFVTFLRRPEAAFISELRYVQRNFWSLSEPVRRLWPRETPHLTLRELAERYLDQEAAVQDLCPQTRFLCHPEVGDSFGLSDCNRKGVNSYEMAHQILTGFHFVGIVEEMKKSLEVLADRLLDRGTRVYFDHNLKLNTSLEASNPEWLTPEDKVGQRVLAASESDRRLHEHFREELLESHRVLRKRRWLGFRPAAADAAEAFSTSWSDGVRSLITSVHLYRSRRTDHIERPVTPTLSADLLEVRAAEAVADRLYAAELLRGERQEVGLDTHLSQRARSSFTLQETPSKPPAT